MGGNQSNTVKEIQTITNNIFEESQEVCIATCTAIQGGDVISLSGVTAGNVTLTNQCEASASCAMNQSLSSQITAIMKAMSQQTNTTSDLFPFSMKWNAQNNSLTIMQAIRNNITQTMEAICQSSDTNIQENDVIVLTNDDLGNITLSNKGSANSTCTLNNVARQVAFNQQTAKGSQTNKMTSIFTTILIIIVLVIIFVALIILLFLGPIGIKNLFGSTGEKKDGESDSGILQGLLAPGGGEKGEDAEGGEVEESAEGGELATGGEIDELAEVALL